MDNISKERTGEYLILAIKILEEHGGELPSSELIKEMTLRLNLSEFEKSLNKSGQYRWLTRFRFHSIGLSKGGILKKDKSTWELINMTEEIRKFSQIEMFNFSVESYEKWNKNRTKEEIVMNEIDEENDEPEILMQVKPDDINFQDLISGISSCKIQIPPFQRSFIWKPSDIRYLLDSIYRGYPIGSFIFWKTTRKLPHTRNIGNIHFDQKIVSEGSEISYVLDGQQRITSLYAAVKGADIEGEKFRFLFDIKSKKFIVNKIGEKKPEELVEEDKNNLQISIESVISNSLGAYRELCRQYGPNESYANTLDTLYERFVSYRFSVVNVIDKNIVEEEGKNEGVKQVVRMFSRINETGKKLTVVAKMVARCWGEGFDLRESLDKFFDQSINLESIREETLLQASSVILNYKKASNRDILERTNIQKLESDWDEIIDAFLLSIDFVTTKLNIKSLDYLPFDSILVSLTYLFNKKRALNQTETQFVEKWFWQVSLSNRYDSTVHSKIEEDCEVFDQLLEGKTPKLNYLIDWETLKSRLIEQPYNLRNAFVKTILALYSYANPKDLVAGRNVTFENSFTSWYKHNLHHIFPQEYLRNNESKQKELFDSITNIMFIPAITNNNISGKAPSIYLSSLQKSNTKLNEILIDHYIPNIEKSRLLENDFLGFLNYRADQVYQAFRIRTGVASASEEFFESNPSKPIDILEVKMRSLINDTLKKQVEDSYWEEYIPSDIRYSVDLKIKESIKRNPFSVDQYKDDNVKINFLEIMDYLKIILSNWKLFERFLGSKSEVEKHFLALKNYRNPIKHGREMNDIDKKNGEAAVLWFENVLLPN